MNCDSVSSLRSRMVCGLGSTPSAASTALMAAIWWPTQQMPQMRLTIQGTSCGSMPWTSRSKKRLASTISSLTSFTTPSVVLILMLPWPSTRVT
jgi:hypothetical protein